ncbi:lipid droplet-associated protein [Amycolatopsis mongoliensis]|uniref:Lipid droplet-associated protein n=1 Tax=Amycolatopsis mongoliensis TaxID=715475 RepID=A0A9Y2JYI3_9PSEU|nr:lipid droplet-associated protein [Amycolatopsis sp. 4-36]WIY05857.1 lipid droplet-associated protein [Amycolatopsis sp. 4-36]
MKPFPLPLRVAAGLAVSTAERVRELPRQLAGLPVTVVSQVLQASMRVQQHVTELAIKGDNALSSLRPVEDAPSWATFDEDIEAPVPPARPNLTPVADVPEPRSEINGHIPSAAELEAELGDPWAEEERALAENHADGENDSGADDGEKQDEAPRTPKPGTPKADKSKTDTPRTSAAGYDGPAGLTGYDQLTLPQLRARLRQLSIPQLETILEYERAHADRSSFTGMLSRRIANARKAEQAEEHGTEGQ